MFSKSDRCVRILTSFKLVREGIPRHGPTEPFTARCLSRCAVSYLQVWKLPKQSFGHRIVSTFKQHKRAITALSVTKAHLFSACDEGHLRVWSLGTLCLQRVSHRMSQTRTWLIHGVIARKATKTENHVITYPKLQRVC